MLRDALMLQGPVGPFFSRFAKELETRGFRVWKINFNSGDRAYFGGSRAVDYTGNLEAWGQYLERFLLRRQIGRIYLFGDCRSYHRIAREIASALDIPVYVFEEGYIRPNFITLEKGGVNGHSPMMTSPPDLEKTPRPVNTDMPQPRHVFVLMAFHAIVYYTMAAFGRRRFPGYHHHRPTGCLSEGWIWLHSGFRKYMYRIRERGTLKHLEADSYYVCPLQVHCDMQVVVHSDFKSIEHFIGDVLASFALNAPADKSLVFKHHPLDRGYTDYSQVVKRLAKELGIEGRVHYVHDVELPGLLRKAKGTVLINSTVGVSSIFHGTPVKTLGRAVFDLPGLTEQCSLDEFWTCDSTLDASVFARYREHLKSLNQLNGNFYRRIASSTASGINWSPDLLSDHTWYRTYEAPRLRVVPVAVKIDDQTGMDDRGAKAA